VQGPHAARRDRDHGAIDVVFGSATGEQPVINLHREGNAATTRRMWTPVAYMTDDACEANYRGDGARGQGRHAFRPCRRVRPLAAEHAEIRDAQRSAITLMRDVTRGPATDGSAW
jgi:hypothetical protein